MAEEEAWSFSPLVADLATRTSIDRWRHGAPSEIDLTGLGLVAGIWLQKARSFRVRGCGLRRAVDWGREEQRDGGLPVRLGRGEGVAATYANGKKRAAWKFGAEHVKRNHALSRAAAPLPFNSSFEELLFFFLSFVLSRLFSGFPFYCTACRLRSLQWTIRLKTIRACTTVQSAVVYLTHR
jgi:hypothetical protein